MNAIAMRLSFALTAVCVALAGGARAQVVVREDDHFSNSAFVKTSDEAEADLFAGDLKAKEGDIGAAFTAWQRVLDRGDVAQDGSAVLVSFRERTFLSGSEAVRRRLEGANDDAKRRYRERFEARAAGSVADAKAAHDLAGLFDAARRFPITGAAIAALRAAAVLALDRGDAALAARALHTLGARGPLATADVLRLALAYERAGDARGIAQLKADVRARTSEVVLVSGRASTLGAEFDSIAAQLPPEGAAPRDDLSARVFAQIPLRYLRQDSSEDPRGARPPAFPNCGLAFVGDRVIVTTRDGVLGFTVADGHESFNKDYSQLVNFDPESEEIADRTLEPATDGARIYFALTRHELAYAEPAPTYSFLVALEADGALAWKADVEHDPELAAYRGYAFEGSPVVDGNLVLVSASRLASVTECAVFAFDRATGALRWQRFVASATALARYASRNQNVAEQRVHPAPLVVDGGDAFCVTNLGVVACLDTMSGAIRWAYKTNRIDPQDDSFRRERYYDTGGWLHGRPLLVGRKLVVTPEDARFVYVLQRDPSLEGYLVLNEPAFKRDRDVLVGADPNSETLYFLMRKVAGPLRDSVCACATNFDGAVLWSSVPLEVEERASGRPILANGLVLLPTTKALYGLRMQDGVTALQIPAPAFLVHDRIGMVFGNVVARGGDLWSVSPRFVLRFLPAP